MAEGGGQLVIEENDKFCGCFPTKKRKSVQEGEYVKKDKITFEMLKQDEINEYVKRGEATFNDLSQEEQEQYKKKSEITFDDLNQEMKKKYIDVDNMNFNGLTKQQQDKITQEVHEKGKVDGTITWDEFFRYDNNLSKMKKAYLQGQEGLSKFGREYGEKSKFNDELKGGRMPDDIATLRTREGRSIEQTQLTKDVISRMKSTKGDNRPFVELYDPEARTLASIVGYNLSKVNDYQLALVIPKYSFEQN